MGTVTATGTGTGTVMMTARPKSENKWLPQRMTTRSCLLFIGVFLATVFQSNLASARAGKWVFDPSSPVTARLTFVDRNPDDTGDNSGQVIQVSPNLRLSRAGGRAEANINYTPTISVGFGDTDPKFLTHQLLGTGRVEAVENRFFIGADARAGLKGANSTGEFVDAINFNSALAEQGYSFGITPEYRQPLNRYADFVSNNRFDWVGSSGNDFGEGSGSRGQRLNASILSGRHFNAFNWSLNATQRKTFYDSDRDDSTRTDYRAGLGYRFGPRWAANGSIGYEDNDISTNRANTNGTTWDVGARWTPTPRTSLNATVGERYFGERYSADISHRSRRTRLSAGLSRDVTNQRQQQLVDALFFLVDGSGNPVLDQDGNPIIANIPQLQDTNEDFINTQLRGAMTITGRRTSVTITGNIANRDYEVSPRDEDSYDLTVGVRRDLGSSFNAGLTGRMRHVDSSSAGKTDNYEVRFSLSKNLSSRTSTAINLGYRDYDTDRPDGSYTETRIGISLTTRLF